MDKDKERPTDKQTERKREEADYESKGKRKCKRMDHQVRRRWKLRPNEEELGQTSWGEAAATWLGRRRRSTTTHTFRDVEWNTGMSRIRMASHKKRHLSETQAHIMKWIQVQREMKTQVSKYLTSSFHYHELRLIPEINPFPSTSLRWWSSTTLITAPTTSTPTHANYFTLMMRSRG